MPANVVTSWSFRGADGSIGPVGATQVGGGGGGGSGGSGTYFVQPIAFWASDTATNTTAFPPANGYTVPYSQSAFKARMDASILRIRQYYWDRCGRYTFDAAPAVLYVSPSTTAALTTDPSPGGGSYLQVKNALDEVSAARADVDNADVAQLNYVFMMAPGGIDAQGRTFVYTSAGDQSAGNVNLGGVGYPPFLCASTLTFNSARDFGAPRPDAPSTGENMVIIAAHELCHALSYDPATLNIGAHTAIPGNLLKFPIDVGTLDATSLTAGQVALLKASPFMAFNTNRPL